MGFIGKGVVLIASAELQIRGGIHRILFLHENVCCGYSLEAPWLGNSNEYHNRCICGEIRRMSILFGRKGTLSSGYMEIACGFFSISGISCMLLHYSWFLNLQ